MKSHKVRVWDVREGRASRTAKDKPTRGKKPTTYEVRWIVEGREKSRTFATKTLANSFRAKLITAMNNGEAFNIDSGLPDSMIEKPAPKATTCLELAVRYVDTKWKGLSAKSRATTVEALAALLPGLCADLKDRPDTHLLRWALCRWHMPPAMRDEDAASPPAKVAAALDWLQHASLPVSALDDAEVALAGRDAMLTKLDGKPYASDVIRRRRSILTNLVKYAILVKEMHGDPFKDLPWSSSKKSRQIDRRRVPNPRQLAELLAAISYVGSWKRGRGRRLVAFFACMYYGFMRPEEVIGLREDDCELPTKGWGLLTLAKAHPNAGKLWTDSGEVHDDKGLKQREDGETRPVPIPPVLVRILREHIKTFGTARDGRLFQNERGGKVAGSTYSRVYQEAREFALTPRQRRSTLAAEPYDLRHAGISLALRSTQDAARVAERAGNSIEVLLSRYAWAIDDKDNAANAAIEKALDE